MGMSAPRHYLKSLPTEQTVTFGGEYIDLKGIAAEVDLNYTYLSHIFSANSAKLPSTNYGRKLAEALGMDYGDFITELLKKKSAAA